jgi:transmembrane sensor
MNERLSKFARPRIDDARLARQWSAISRGRARARSGAWTLAFAAAAVAVACFVTWRLARRTPVVIAARANVSELASDATSSTMVLADGSRVTIGPSSRLLVRETSTTETRVELVAGSADFAVKHDPARAFVVVAHGVSVVDTGTTFHVEYTSPTDVRVSVSEGSVRLERAQGAPSSLIAGESWTSATPAPVETAIDAGETPEATRDAGAARVQADDSFARFSAIADRDPAGAFEVFGVAGYPRAIQRATPKQLFELADAARLSDHPAQAADAFDALRSRHRSDPRAGLAALQLARLREDTLHDPSGAEAALRDAIALAPDATLREDAEARRVGVLEKMNDKPGCIQARDAYLAKYPTGIHRAKVEKSCGG